MSAPVLVGRLVGLDVLRGAAIVAMMLDHLAYAVGADAVRWTVGRLAMPVFFVVAGALVRRLTVRHLGVAALGLLLPVLVPWIDSPNVLLLYALSVPVLVLTSRSHVIRGVVLVLVLTVSANGLGELGTGYPWPLLLALMLVGQDVGPRLLARCGDWLPRWPVLAMVGRAPLRWYVGHLLVLQAALVVMP